MCERLAKNKRMEGRQWVLIVVQSGEVAPNRIGHAKPKEAAHRLHITFEIYNLLHSQWLYCLEVELF
jgi:hypothetical protein